MKIRIFLFVFAVFFFSTPSYAQIYKYHDAEGNIHFTDDISRVPVDTISGSNSTSSPA